MEGHAALLPRRRDEEGEWHDLVRSDCADCSCTAYRAADDPAILWEPGRAWADDCRDRDCHCHTAPLDGAPRTT